MTASTSAMQSDPPGNGKHHRSRKERRRRLADGRDVAKTIVGRQVDALLDAAGARLTRTAHSLRTMGQTMRDAADDPMAGDAVEFVASYVQRAADYFEKADSDRVVRDLEWYGRRYPVVVAGAAFATGLLVSRFVKVSSAERLHDAHDDGNE